MLIFWLDYAYFAGKIGQLKDNIMQLGNEYNKG